MMKHRRRCAKSVRREWKEYKRFKRARGKAGGAGFNGQDQGPPPPPPPGANPGYYTRYETRDLSRPYRSRRGIVMGVCRGLAEYFEVSVSMTRAATIIVCVFTGFWPVAGLYFLAALLLKPEPVLPFERYEERQFYDSYTESRSSAVSRLQGMHDAIDRRMQRIEDIVTSRDFDWEQRMSK